MLISPHRISLVGRNQWHGLFMLHMPSLRSRLTARDPRDRPHPALLEPLYLLGCYFTSRLPPSESLTQLEEVFLARSHRALAESLSYSDRLMDFLRGSSLVAGYLFLKGRFLEGYV